MTRQRATLIGCGAIGLWALLAALTVATGEIPPFELAAMAFTVAGGVGLASLALRPGSAAALRQPPIVWLVGVGGLFGYHALYFAALRLAPPAIAKVMAASSNGGTLPVAAVSMASSAQSAMAPQPISVAVVLENVAGMGSLVTKRESRAAARRPQETAR